MKYFYPLVLIILLMAPTIQAEPGIDTLKDYENIIGTWDGHMEVPGTKIALEVTFSMENGELTGTSKFAGKDNSATLKLEEVALDFPLLKYRVPTSPPSEVDGEFFGNEFEGESNFGPIPATIILKKRTSD